VEKETHLLAEQTLQKQERSSESEESRSLLEDEGREFVSEGMIGGQLKISEPQQIYDRLTSSQKSSINWSCPLIWTSL